MKKKDILILIHYNYIFIIIRKCKSRKKVTVVL